MTLALFCAAGLLAADLTLRVLARRGRLKQTPPGCFFRLETLENQGMAGGALRDHPRLARFLPCSALLALLALCAGQLLHGRGLCRWGAALLCAGGLGNGAERLLRGCVTDYIRFPHLPGQRLRRLVWNLADFMLLLGGLFFALGQLRRK